MIQYSEKGRTMETVKRSLVVRGLEERKEGKISGTLRIFRAVKLFCRIL